MTNKENYRFMGFGQPVKKVEESTNYAVGEDGKLLDFQRIEDEAKGKIKYDLRESKLAKKIAQAAIGVLALTGITLYGAQPANTEISKMEYLGYHLEHGLKEMVFQKDGKKYEIANGLSDDKVKGLKVGKTYFVQVEKPNLRFFFKDEVVSVK